MPDYMTPAAVALPSLALLSCVLCMAPLAWHVRNGNFAASSLVMWIVLVNFFSFVNALIWPTDDTSTWFNGAGLCDVEVKLLVGSFVGVSGSMLCIIRSLSEALDTKNALIPSSARRRRQRILEVVLCVGFPAWIMLAHYFVQPYRYAIETITGCAVTIYPSVFAILLIPVWPMVLCILDLGYALVVFYRVKKYRKEFASIIEARDPKLNKSRFIRLFALCFAMIIILVPVQGYIFYRNVSDSDLLPYSWSASHTAAWTHVQYIPTGGKVEFDRWIQVIFGIFVFAFFGFGKDATVMYQAWMEKSGLGKLGKTFTAASDSTASLLNSFGSRAKAWSGSTTSQNEHSYWAGTFSSRKGSVAGTTLASSPNLSKHMSYEMPTLDSIDESCPKPKSSSTSLLQHFRFSQGESSSNGAQIMEEGRIQVKKEFKVDEHHAM